MEKIFNYRGKKFLPSMSDRLPVSPYRYEKKINQEKAYLVDGEGFVWILTDRIINNNDYGLCYYDGCLRECVTYIVMYDGYYNYLNMKYYIGEHLTVKEKCYNEFLGKYDNIGGNNMKKSEEIEGKMTKNDMLQERIAELEAVLKESYDALVLLGLLDKSNLVGNTLKSIEKVIGKKE